MRHVNQFDNARVPVDRDPLPVLDDARRFLGLHDGWDLVFASNQCSVL